MDKPITKKEYREHLNKLHGIDKTGKGTNNKFKPRTRLYGDYLWYQDREMFDVSYIEYINESI